MRSCGGVVDGRVKKEKGGGLSVGCCGRVVRKGMGGGMMVGMSNL